MTRDNLVDRIIKRLSEKLERNNAKIAHYKSCVLDNVLGANADEQDSRTLENNT